MVIGSKLAVVVLTRSESTILHSYLPIIRPPLIRIETVAWEPRAFVYHHFLTEAEVNHLVKIGSQRGRDGARDDCGRAVQVRWGNK